MPLHLYISGCSPFLASSDGHGHFLIMSKKNAENLFVHSLCFHCNHDSIAFFLLVKAWGLQHELFPLGQSPRTTHVSHTIELPSDAADQSHDKSCMLPDLGLPRRIRFRSLHWRVSQCPLLSVTTLGWLPVGLKVDSYAFLCHHEHWAGVKAFTAGWLVLGGRVLLTATINLQTWMSRWALSS